MTVYTLQTFADWQHDPTFGGPKGQTREQVFGSLILKQSAFVCHVCRQYRPRLLALEGEQGDDGGEWHCFLCLECVTQMQQLFERGALVPLEA